jgi:hypothetical protein
LKRSRWYVWLCGLGILLGSGGLLWYCHATPVQEIILTDDPARRQYLTQYGCTPDETPPTSAAITLPESDASTVYAAYLALQKAQQLPLAQYAGTDAVLWTYTLTDDETARAELICTPDGLLLGAMRYDCTRFDRMEPVMEQTLSADYQ